MLGLLCALSTSFSPAFQAHSSLSIRTKQMDTVTEPYPSV